jgi:hypothetical protein
MGAPRCSVVAVVEEDEQVQTIRVLDLFVRYPLNEVLEQRRQKAHQQLVDMPVDEFLATPERDLVDMLVASASIECPTLCREEAQLLGSPVGPILFHRVYTKVVREFATCFTLAVPIIGNPEMFARKPTTYPTNPPMANIYPAQENQWEMRLYCEGGREAHEVKSDFDAQLDQIEQCLTWSRNDIDAHRRTLEIEIRKIASERRAKLLADRNIHANIGFPIRRRPDADTYTVPIRRRKVDAPRKAPSAPLAPFEPEPILPADDYEAALRALINMRNALERSPSTTEQLTENGIRDLLLVSLNAQFEGSAAGEVFNGEGKTDILIRSDDRNVFIAECKIWRGHQTVTGALDQLLSYLVWRDTKAALLLFIRDADVTAVTEKAIAQITAHPNYKRRGKIANDERHDFVIHANGDPHREIHLAFLPFLIARRKRPTPT